MRNSKAPAWLKEMVDGVDMRKKRAFEKLKSLPVGINFMPGVAACGKSTFLQNIILEAFTVIALQMPL